MIPSYRVGETRMRLAKILTEYLGEYVAPTLIETNHSEKGSLSRWCGYTWSWSVRVGNGPHSHEVGSSQTMTEFIRESKYGIASFAFGDLKAGKGYATATQAQTDAGATKAERESEKGEQ